MNTAHDHRWSRRRFLAAAAAAAATSPLRGAPSTQPRLTNTKLGFDNFSIRTCGWKAPKLIEYAASLKVDTLLLSDLDVYESHDEAYLRNLRTKAADSGIELQAGTGSICPTSSRYDAKKWGKAEDHARLLIRVAKHIGSSVARCFIGGRGERGGDGGIYRHIDATVKVCKAVRTEAEDANVKLAIENHAGDMQAWELVTLIEAAGPSYVGATLDSGNATWTLEDPLVNLEILAPYAGTTGIRDSAVWETENGATAMWANMGQGLVDWKTYVESFKKLCPSTPFVLEMISYRWERELAYLKKQFWNEFPKARAHEFARFVALAKRGRRYTLPPGRPTSGPDLEARQQRFDLEESLKYCRAELGLGAKK